MVRERLLIPHKAREVTASEAEKAIQKWPLGQ
jgi:hypothetical protein